MMYPPSYASDIGMSSAKQPIQTGGNQYKNTRSARNGGFGLPATSNTSKFARSIVPRNTGIPLPKSVRS